MPAEGSAPNAVWSAWRRRFTFVHETCATASATIKITSIKRAQLRPRPVCRRNIQADKPQTAAAINAAPNAAQTQSPEKTATAPPLTIAPSSAINAGAHGIPEI
jgi:hypothetical protein